MEVHERILLTFNETIKIHMYMKETLQLTEGRAFL